MQDNPRNQPDRSRDGPMSLLRTLKILEYVAGHADAMPLAKLSVALETPKSSLLGLLRALSQHGYLVNVDGRYSLGPTAHRLAISIVPAFPLSKLARPIMRDLVATTGETALLSTLDLDMKRVVYVEKYESSNIVRYTVPVGTSRPLYCTAAGRLLLAYQSPEWVSLYLKVLAEQGEDLAPPADMDAIRAALKQIRAAQVSTTAGDFSPEVVGIAAPVFDHQGNAVAALTLGAPLERGRKNLASLIKATCAGAEKMSSYLGHIPTQARDRRSRH